MDDSGQDSMVHSRRSGRRLHICAPHGMAAMIVFYVAYSFIWLSAGITAYRKWRYPWLYGRKPKDDYVWGGVYGRDV